MLLSMPRIAVAAAVWLVLNPVALMADDDLAPSELDDPMNRVELIQDGDNHNAFLSQTGYGNLATAVQSEFAGTSSIGQRGNDLNVDQRGDENEVYIMQRGSENDALLSQIGDRNNILLRQQGKGNRSDLSQSGDDNLADVTQIGRNNSVDLLQVGVGMEVTVIQDGTDGALKISQPNN